MALEKVVTYEQQVYHPSSVHVRIRTGIVEDGKEVSFSYSRKVVMCDEDYSDQDSQTKSVCDAVFTDEVKAAHAAFRKDQNDKGLLKKDYADDE
jgi:hypothetical protein